jgi:hypothetical protein
VDRGGARAARGEVNGSRRETTDFAKAKVTLQTRAVAMVSHAAAYLAGIEAGWTQSLERLAEELARSSGVRQVRVEFIKKTKRTTKCK